MNTTLISTHCIHVVISEVELRTVYIKGPLMQ